MKKFYTLLFALIAFVATGQAETKTKYTLTTLGDAKTTLTDLSGGQNIMLYQNDGGKRPIWIVGPTTSGGNLTLDKTAVDNVTNGYDVTNMLFTLEKVENEDNTYYIKANSNGEYIRCTITTNSTNSNFNNSNYDAVLTSSKENATKIVITKPNNSNFLLSPSTPTGIHLNVQQSPNGQWYENSLVNWWTGTGGYSQWYIYVPTTSETEVTTYTVTWNITYNNGTTVPGTNGLTSEVERGGTATIPASTYPFTTYTTTEDLTNITEDKTINATATFNTPFVASTNYDGAIWYYIRNANSDNTTGNKQDYIYYSAEETTKIPAQSTLQSTDAFKWAFIGNPIDGYKVINKQAGSGKYVYASSASEQPHLADTEGKWYIQAGKSNITVNGSSVTTFGLCLDKNTSSYWNWQGRQVKYWSSSTGDTGSNWLIEYDTPTSGTYYRIKSYVSNGYLTSPSIGSDESVKAAKSDSPSTPTIWYYHSGSGNENYLLSYYSGEYLSTGQGNGNVSISRNVPNTTNSGLTVNDYGKGLFGFDQRNSGWWFIQSETLDEAVTSDKAAEAASYDKSKWSVEVVTSLPVTLHKVGSETNAYGTLALPVAVDLASGDKTEAYVVTDIKDNYVTLKQIEADESTNVVTVPANTPVLLVNTAGTESISVTPNYSYTGSYDGTNKLVGVYTATAYNPNTGDDNYYLTAVDSKPGFYQVTNYSGKYLTNKAYLSGSAASTSKGFSFLFGGDDDPTGISSATGETDATAFDADAPRYNLQGQRVGQDYKGIVVVNGRKYLLK